MKRYSTRYYRPVVLYRPVITGPHTRNQRVEISWRDGFERCVCVFHHFFTQFEEEGILNLETVDLLAIEYTYLGLGVIENHVDIFRRTWNNHTMRTEHNMTPNELFESRREVGDLQLPVSDEQMLSNEIQVKKLFFLL